MARYRLLVGVGSIPFLLIHGDFQPKKKDTTSQSKELTQIK